jgi:transcriptional regulator with XRE-family HTH domain
MSMFGRQPAADVLKAKGISRQVAAQRIGVQHSVLNNTLAGRQTPSETVRKGLVKLLDTPLEKLFNPEPLARVQGKRYRQGAVITAGDDPTIKHMRRKKKDESSGTVDDDEDREGDRIVEKMNGTEG